MSKSDQSRSGMANQNPSQKPGQQSQQQQGQKPQQQGDRERQVSRGGPAHQQPGGDAGFGKDPNSRR